MLDMVPLLEFTKQNGGAGKGLRGGGKILPGGKNIFD